MENLLKRRFAELDEQARVVDAGKKYEATMRGSTSQLNIEYSVFLEWKVKAKSLIEKACGSESQHLKEFEKAETSNGFDTTWRKFLRVRAVFDAAREDFEGGYLVSMRTLVQAEVFDSELEQAKELHKSGYEVAAAVIAGTVLETCLRDLCTRNDISHSKLDKMNAELAKAGVYNGLVQKRITHLAAVRNSAAHGNNEEFGTYDVTAMLDEIERFVTQHLV